MAAVLRVIGPPGSGKTLLIVSLTEALRERGHRVASVAPRRDGATVVVLSNAARVTIEQPLSLTRLRAVIPSIDPSVEIILAEGYDTPQDAALPAVALLPPGAEPRADALANVPTARLEAVFARRGPGDTDGLVDLVERHVLGIAPRTTPVRGWRRALGWLRR